MKLDNLKQLIKEELNRTLNENVRNNKDIKAGEYEITSIIEEYSALNNL